MIIFKEEEMSELINDRWANNYINRGIIDLCQNKIATLNSKNMTSAMREGQA